MSRRLPARSSEKSRSPSARSPAPSPAESSMIRAASLQQVQFSARRGRRFVRARIGGQPAVPRRRHQPRRGARQVRRQLADLHGPRQRRHMLGVDLPLDSAHLEKGDESDDARGQGEEDRRAEARRDLDPEAPAPGQLPGEPASFRRNLPRLGGSGLGRRVSPVPRVALISLIRAVRLVLLVRGRRLLAVRGRRLGFLRCGSLCFLRVPGPAGLPAAPGERVAERRGDGEGRAPRPAVPRLLPAPAARRPARPFPPCRSGAPPGGSPAGVMRDRTFSPQSGQGSKPPIRLDPGQEHPGRSPGCLPVRTRARSRRNQRCGWWRASPGNWPARVRARPGPGPRR